MSDSKTSKYIWNLVKSNFYKLRPKIYFYNDSGSITESVSEREFEMIMWEWDEDIYTGGDHDVTFYSDLKKITRGLTNSL